MPSSLYHTLLDLRTAREEKPPTPKEVDDYIEKHNIEYLLDSAANDACKHLVQV